MPSDNAGFLIKCGKLYLQHKGLLGGYVLRVRNGSIEEISDSMHIPHDITIFDYSSYVITPRFCDHHVHFFDSSSEALQQTVEALTIHGIGTAYDGGSSSLDGLRGKEYFQRTFDLKTCGYALYKKGRYGGFLGKGISTLQEARSATDELCLLGVDYLKIINSGIVDIHSGDISEGGFEREELRDIIDYAASKDFPVYCHASGDRAIRDAVEAGASVIIHGFQVSDETLALMNEKKTALIPTVAALCYLRDAAGNAKAQSKIERLADIHLRTIKKASEIGVTILPGSDSGPDLLPYGSTFLDEINFFRQAGLSVNTILSFATTNQIEKGSKANLVVLDGMILSKDRISVIDRFTSMK